MTMTLTPSFDGALPPRGASRVTRALLDGVERDVVLAYSIGGMHAVLGTLNARTRFRITALCPLESGPGARVWVYDREDPRGQLDASLGEVCSIARLVVDGGAATRIAASHAGAAVRTTTGRLWGALLHYDLRLRTAAPLECTILEHFGRTFAALFPGEIGAAS